MTYANEFAALYGPHFTFDEFKCKCGKCVGIVRWWETPEFRSFMLEGLVPMRRSLGFPFHVNSGYRCPAYNDQIYIDMGHEPGEHTDGPHTKGAADIGVSFERMYAIVGWATAARMGVGIHQRGPVAGRYIHVDNLGPRIWTY